MEYLTKESFWNRIEKNYAGEFNVFIQWIDKYKERVNWNELFNSNSEYQNSAGKNAPSPKYHDLPTAMQAGIFLQYVLETKGAHRYAIVFDTEDMKNTHTIAELIEEWFCEEHSNALNDKYREEEEDIANQTEIAGAVPPDTAEGDNIPDDLPF